MKEKYYVYVSSNGELGRAAKRTSDGKYYGWEKGEWVEMPNLKRMEFDITNFEEITKKQLEGIIKSKK